MKTFRFFATVAVLAATCTIVFASETSDKFAEWVRDFASPDIKQRQEAQQNWQTYCREKGNDSNIRKEIVQVSVNQLAKANPVDTTVWIMRQLGTVCDASDKMTIQVLGKCLEDNEVRVRDEAARALANIPGKEVEDIVKRINGRGESQLVKDLMTSRTIKADIPSNTAVESQYPQAIPYVPMANLNEVAAWLKGYDKLGDMEKAQVLSNLTARAARAQVIFQKRRIQGQSTDRQDDLVRVYAHYIPYALDAVKSSDESLRNAGILAVGTLGGTKEIPFLLEQAHSGENKDLAKLALVRMSGKGIDDTLIANLKTEQNAEKFNILADILNRRYNQEIGPILLERAKAAGTENRLQLLQLAEPTSTKAHIGDFVKAWALISDRGQKNQAEQVIARLSGGDAKPALQALANDWETPDALSLLGRIGDAGTIDKIKQNKNAVRAFSNWPNAQVANDLLAIARNEKNSEEDRRSAFRAYVRVMSLPHDQLGIDIKDAARVEQLADAFSLAKQVDDKRLVIQRVGQIRTVESLLFILKYYDEAELQEAVCGAILDLAHHVDFKRTAMEEFDAALDKVLAALDKISNDNVRNQFRDRANRYKTQR